MTKTYWEDTVQSIRGLKSLPDSSDILVIGSGFTGASAAYFLAESGNYSVTMVDDGRTGSWSRNAGHILWGLSEHYVCQQESMGKQQAREMGKLSAQFCQVADSLYADYDMNVYAVHPMHDQEKALISNSTTARIDDFGYDPKDALSGRGHPVMNRNSLVNHALNAGVKYHEMDVSRIVKTDDGYRVTDGLSKPRFFQSVVVCTNASVSNLFPGMRSAVKPFKGQVIVSEKLSGDTINDLDYEFGSAWSFDNGFIYGQFIEGRILIGGWRNNAAKSKDESVEDMATPEAVDAEISEGLKEFVAEKFNLKGLIWNYSWTGAMASTPNGIPIVKQRASDGIYVATGMNGYGQAWGPGCGMEVANMVLGEPVDPAVLKYMRGD